MSDDVLQKDAGDLWFSGERVFVRRLLIEDICPDYVAWFSDIAIRKFIKYAHKTSDLIDLQNYWRLKSADPGVDFLGIFDREHNKHIGNIKFEKATNKSEMHVGFLIGEAKYRRQGLIRECLAGTIAELRLRREVRRIYLTVDPNNRAALQAFVRLGFKFTGHVNSIGDLEMDYLNV